MGNSIRVVGIGASAGGLEAITDFFEHVPANLNMAFIVIQHLSPDHKSLMNELLRKHTSLPIEVITEERELQANHIYLISAQSNVMLEDGRLCPVSRGDRGRLNLPIDQFFHSLAEECGPNAVGIILSGTGTDGSRGIAAIKKQGGIVIVQDPETAQFDGMPQTAIQTGMVDQVLPPAAIAKALSNILQRKKDGLMILDSQDDSLYDQLEIILSFVEQHAEVDFREYRQSTLLRRIEKRMLVKKINSIEAYVDYLQDTPQEAHALYREFLIGVTRFFRDTPAFDILRDEVIPHLARHHDRKQPIRVWCAGCSTGEEAYTIALLIKEYATQQQEPLAFKIFASDLDARAVEVANRGVYSTHIRNTVPLHFLERYFNKTSDGYRITKEIREQIVFTVHDAMADPPFINIDLVSCRNLLIYINSQSQQQLLNNFQFSLRESGYLFLGPSESLGIAGQNFATLSDRWNVYQLTNKQRPPLGRKFRLPRTFTSLRSGDSDPEGSALDPHSRDHRTDNTLYQRVLLKRFAPISLFVDQELNILYSHGAVEKLFGFPKSADDFTLRKMVELDSLALFENGVQKSLELNKTFRYENVPYEYDGRHMRLRATFDTIREEADARQIVLINLTILGELPPDEIYESINEDTYRQEQIKLLERRLRESMSIRQSLTEKLEATNEELQSSNEELLATNEELQSTNEELQSLNEELYTVNSELQSKVEELTITNSDLDNLLESTEVGTIFVDRNLRIRKFTPAIQQQFDLLDNDIGRPITNFVNSFADDSIYRDASEVIDTGKMIERELRDEKGASYLMRILPYRLQEKSIIDGVVITFTDISPLRSALAEKEEQAERFMALFQHADANIAVIDPEDNFTEINREAFGAPPGNLIGKNLMEILGETIFASHYAKAKKQVLQTHEPAQFIAPIQLPGEKDLWFACTLIPILTEQRLKCFVLMSRDETQPRRLLGETYRKVAIFNAWYRYGNHHIMTTDAEGVIQDLNYITTGYDVKDLLGKGLLEILPEENRPQIREILHRLKRGERQISYENTIKPEDGSAALHFENLVLRVDPREDESLHFIWISRDATEAHRLSRQVWELERQMSTNLEEQSAELLSKNRELRDINYYLDSFVQSAAHDLRAPVTQLDGLLGLTTDENAPRLFPEIRKNMLTAVRQLRQTIDGLVEMIDFEKQDSSKARKIDLNTLVRHMIDHARRNYPSVSVKTKLDLANELQVYYPEPYIRSLLHNLLDNAIKYRAQNNAVRIVIRTRRTGPREIMLSVRDNGIGIDMNRYGHLLFQPFKRLTAERPGTGIGLSIVNNAIRRNGGRFEVESKLGAGAEFRAYLVSYDPPSTEGEEE